MFAQPLNTCKSTKGLFLMPKPGCARAEKGLLLQLVSFLAFFSPHAFSAVTVTGCFVVLIIESKKEKKKSAFQSIVD